MIGKRLCLGIIEWRWETFHEWELSKCRNVSFSTQSSKVNLKLGTANLWLCYWRGGGSSLRVEQSSEGSCACFLLNKLDLIFLFFLLRSKDKQYILKILIPLFLNNQIDCKE